MRECGEQAFDARESEFDGERLVTQTEQIAKRLIESHAPSSVRGLTELLRFCDEIGVPALIKEWLTRADSAYIARILLFLGLGFFGLRF